MKSSNQLYKLLNISGSRWEISTEQEPEDYISVIKQIIFRDSEDYLEVIIPTDVKVMHSGEINQRKDDEDSLEASRSTMPPVVVLPAEIPCENPGEIFILLREEVIAETVEVEFISNKVHIRTQPTLWNKKVWCMKALDFPAGSVNVSIYCDGIIKATAEVKYYARAESVECTHRAADPGEGLCKNDIEELDDILTSIFKNEIPYYEFQSLQNEIYPQKEYTHVKQLPTLLHCAAKFGLKNLAIHLLQCSGATWAFKMKNMAGWDPAQIAERCGHKELKKIFEDFLVQEISRNNDQEYYYEEDIIPFSPYSTSSQYPALHHESRKTHRQSADGIEATKGAREEEEPESHTQERHSPSEFGSGSPEDQYDDLYVFIPGTDPESDSQEPPMCCRPPLPPPRPASTAFQLEKPHFTLQTGRVVEGHVERSQNWSYPSARQKKRDESKEEEEKKEDEKKQEEEEEDPYTFTEIDDNEYDLILANMSVKKKTGSRSFIINRPPAPTPRPTNIPPKEEATPYIAQVFQQKAARRQSDDDKFHGLPKKPDKARMESPVFSTARGYLASGQEELILLQEKVKKGKISVDEALEKFKHWQMEKSDLEIIQQEKLRQLRDSIIGKRPEEENFYGKLTIVHHPSGNTAQNENMLYNNPFNHKLPPQLRVEKEFGFCCRKDH
ncbi:B-cell scaffold protein with ankyrin repeats [Sciurus carolinensis]|uniref:B-cell scaffold protein with ankyrin repeats n=1 Tax=Sciurus carolinensis TaxID=30640 RepID=UPI001FB2C397|nr:B-cell scaffold protein with ankyrin repeats [Sciurus carolinensis]